MEHHTADCSCFDKHLAAQDIVSQAQQRNSSMIRGVCTCMNENL